MPTREEMIAAIRSGAHPGAQQSPMAPQGVARANPSREEMIAAIKSRQTPKNESDYGGAALAGLQGFGQGGTLGYLPEIQAGIDVGLDKILPDSMGGDRDISFNDSLAQYRARNEKLKDDHPYASIAGNIAGVAGTFPAGAGAKGLSLGVRALRAAGISGAMGLATNTENPNGDYADLGNRFKNAGYGAALGGGIEGLMGAPKALAGTKFGSFVGNKLSKLGETVTGVPAQDISTYANNPSAVNTMSKTFENNPSLAADDVRETFMKQIKGAKNSANENLSGVLNTSDKTINKDVFINSLEANKKNIDPILYPKDVQKINQVISTLKSLPDTASSEELERILIPELVPQENFQYELGAVTKDNPRKLGEMSLRPPSNEQIEAIANQRQVEPSQLGILEQTVPSNTPKGELPVAKANAVVKFLQQHSEYAQPGDIFQVGGEANKVIKSAARDGRQAVSAAEPESGKINNFLHQLHLWEENTNPNIYTPGKPEAALMTAGSGANPRNTMAVKQLGELTGSNSLLDAQNLSAMRTFGNPSWNPVSTTGKSLLHAGKGAGMGAMLGYGVGGKEGALIGAGIGGASTSPAALKALIDTAGSLSNLGSKIPTNYLTPGLVESAVMRSPWLNMKSKENMK